MKLVNMSAKVLKEMDKEQESATVPECAVCLQCCIHPAQLPCSHIFCFLCIKGVANQSKRCPLCRHEIPADFTEKPCLLNAEESKKTEEEYHWFYEGRNGWWQYDQRTSLELETAFKQGKRTCELLIAGFLYIADFESMLQLRRNDPSRRRRIKRDLHNVPKKGVAGLRLSNHEDEFITREIRGAESSNSQIPNADETVAESTSFVAQSTDDSTEVADQLLRQQTHSLHRVLEQMRSLVLGDSSSYNSTTESNAYASVQEQNSSRI